MIDAQDLDARLASLDANLANALALLEEHQAEMTVLVAKARELVRLLDDAEVNHGSLVGMATMRGRDNLRLELSKWPK